MEQTLSRTKAVTQSLYVIAGLLSSILFYSIIITSVSFSQIVPLIGVGAGIVYWCISGHCTTKLKSFRATLMQFIAGFSGGLIGLLIGLMFK